jgi:uracil-DNA glycosylase family 4
MIDSCNKCNLSKTRKNIVNGAGSENPDIMFVGEAPGSDEDASGEPFVGQAGKMLRNLVKISKLENIRYTNIVRCRPIQLENVCGVMSITNRPPTSLEIEQCFPYLLEELQKYSPKFVIAVGNTSATSLLKYLNVSIPSHIPQVFKLSDIRSFPFKIKTEKSEFYMIPTWHPSYIIRGNYDAMEDVLDDISFAKRIMGGESLEYQTFIIKDVKHFDLMLSKLEGADIIASDVETSPDDNIIGISFSWQLNTGVYVPIKVREGADLCNFWKEQEYDFILNNLKKILDKKYSRIVWHNAKFDTQILNKNFGITFNECEDTRLMWGSLCEGRMYAPESAGKKNFKSNLGYLSRKFFPHLAHYKSRISDRFSDANPDFSQLSLDEIGYYGAMDSLVTLKLYYILKEMQTRKTAFNYFL